MMDFEPPDFHEWDQLPFIQKFAGSAVDFKDFICKLCGASVRWDWRFDKEWKPEKVQYAAATHVAWHRLMHQDGF